jgi:hypothetical protein
MGSAWLAGEIDELALQRGYDAVYAVTCTPTA